MAVTANPRPTVISWPGDSGVCLGVMIFEDVLTDETIPCSTSQGDDGSPAGLSLEHGE